MTEHEAYELAYKNGYSAGYEAGRGSVKHGHWITKDGMTFCPECMVCGSPQWKVCPVCETRMDMPKITDETKKALEAMGRKAHGGGNDELL